MFIGRWLHKGHRWLIDQRLKEGKKCLGYVIRDVEPNENQPWTSNEVLQNVSKELLPLVEEGRVMISIIPDIESVNYGRGVGYEIIEHIPPDDIKQVSQLKLERG